MVEVEIERVIAKFLRFIDKPNILWDSRKLKDTNVFINEHFCEASLVKYTRIAAVTEAS